MGLGRGRREKGGAEVGPGPKAALGTQWRARVRVAATTQVGSRDSMAARVRVAATTKVGSRNSMAARVLVAATTKVGSRDSMAARVRVQGGVSGWESHD